VPHINPVIILAESASSLSATLPSRCLPAALLTAVFAFSAYGLRGVTRNGAIAGAVIAFILYLGADGAGFLGLVSVFLIAYLSSRVGYARKQQLGIAESKRGRTAGQVLANLGAATVCAALAPAFPVQPWLIAAVSALAEAAADTASSECGEALAGQAYLITNFRAVPVGTNGAVSAQGTIAGLLAAFAVASICAVAGMMPFGAVILAVAAAMIGTVADSILGATLERRGVIGNNRVNFVSTALAATVGFSLAKHFH